MAAHSLPTRVSFSAAAGRSVVFGWWHCLFIGLICMAVIAGPVKADLVTQTDALKLNVPEVKSLPIDQARLADIQPAIDAFKAGDAKKFEEAYKVAESKSSALPHRSVSLAKLQIEAGRADLAFNTLEQYLITTPTDPEGIWPWAKSRCDPTD